MWQGFIVIEWCLNGSMAHCPQIILIRTSYLGPLQLHYFVANVFLSKANVAYLCFVVCVLVQLRRIAVSDDILV